jgi:tripartite-type tricarboxylate transporter receptor subunit TctC
MKSHRFWLLSGLATLALAWSGPHAAHAAQKAEYPTRPIELVVPYGSGGGNDLTARVLASVAADYLGQPVIIRIRPGAGSVVGLAEVARSRPDGYTLGWPGPHSLVISAFEKVPLDFMKDLIPIAQMVEWQWFLVVSKGSPFTSLDAFLKEARTKPGSILMANSGNLAIGHLPALELEMHAKAEFRHLPFDGGGPANSSVLTGSAHAVHAVTPAAVPRIQAGDFRGLAVTGKARHPALPDLPTYQELGFPIFTGINVGLVAPAGTPPEVIARLEKAMAEISRDKTYVALLKRLGDRPAFQDAKTYRETMRGYAESAQVVAKRLRAAGVIK